MKRLTLTLIFLLASALTLSACTYESTPRPVAPVEVQKTATSTGIQVSPTETDEQLLNDLNKDTDLDLDLEFQKLEAELQQ
jgi:ABC-type glycerol-3-phosphate transport system substrate-binding protein